MIIRPRHGRQHGMVLIMAMFIVVLVTTVVVSLTWRYQLHSQRNENRWHGTQARAYLEGGEQLAMLMLTEGDLDKNLDTMWEDWAQMTDAMPTDEGWIRGRIEDAQGKFDLNSLLVWHYLQQPEGAQAQVGKVPVTQSVNHLRLIRLLQTLDLSDGPLQPQDATEIVEAITDWIDADSEVTGSGGAEMGEYQSMDPPYFCANRPMASVSELMVIPQIRERPEIYQKLKPLVVALPRLPGQESMEYGININTMPDVMFRIFNYDMDPRPLEADDSRLAGLLEIRSQTVVTGQDGVTTGGFNSVDQFTSAASGLVGQFNTQGLVLKTNWFLFSAETLVGEQVRRSKSLLFRDATGQKVDIIRRTDANF